MQIDWGKDLECKVWGIEQWKHDWSPVAKIQKKLDGNYNVWDIKGAEEFWGTVLSNGKIISDDITVGLVRNKRHVADSQPAMTIKPDNRAVFYFERQGDVYILTGWKNVLGSKEIASKYGEVVNQKYLYTDGEYFHLECGHLWIRDSQRDNAYFTLGEKMTKHQFEKFIKVLKSAGERLSKLVRDSKKPEKIEVVI